MSIYGPGLAPFSLPRACPGCPGQRPQPAPPSVIRPNPPPGSPSPRSPPARRVLFGPSAPAQKPKPPEGLRAPLCHQYPLGRFSPIFIIIKLQ